MRSTPNEAKQCCDASQDGTPQSVHVLIYERGRSLGADDYEGWTRAQLIEEMQRLQNLVDILANTASVHKSNNERGAGRKPTLTSELVAEINAMKASGATLRTISRSLGISLGLVHKACHFDACGVMRSECVHDPDQMSIFEISPRDLM